VTQGTGHHMAAELTRQEESRVDLWWPFCPGLASYDLSLGQVLRAKPTQKPLSPALLKLIRIPKKVSWCRGLFGHKAAGMES